MSKVEGEEEKLSTGIETALITLFCTTTGEGDMSITGVFIDVCTLWFLTADNQYLWTRGRVLDPIKFEKLGERRGRIGFWGERTIWRDDTDDESYCGTTGLWME